jgi:hypothetical protein
VNKDMLARIKSRSQRPKVERDVSFGSQPQTFPNPDEQEIGREEQAPAAEDEQHVQPKEVAQVPEPEQPSLEEQLAQLIQVAPRRNIRLEENLDKEIERFVQEQNLTIETLLEACYLVIRDDEDLQKRVVSEASDRLAERKEAGKLRRLYSQMQKLGG